jgi:hypothetical protein
VPDTDPVLAIAEHLPRDDERAYGADESERNERRDRDGNGNEAKQHGGPDSPPSEDPAGRCSARPFAFAETKDRDADEDKDEGRRRD